AGARRRARGARRRLRARAELGRGEGPGPPEWPPPGTPASPAPPPTRDNCETPASFPPAARLVSRRRREGQGRCHAAWSDRRVVCDEREVTALRGLADPRDRGSQRAFRSFGHAGAFAGERSKSDVVRGGPW